MQPNIPMIVFAILLLSTVLVSLYFIWKRPRKALREAGQRKSKIPIIVFGAILLSIVSIIFCIAVLPWALIYVGLSLSPNPPAPKITHGEFPFRLEYELDGKRAVIKDTLICEYDGIGMDEGRGKFRQWKGHLASGKENVTLLKVSDNLEIYYPEGSAEFYMGDKDLPSTNQSFPDAAFTEIDDGSTSYGRVSSKELLDKYKIKLIKWDFTKPITNTFGSK